MPRQTKKRGSPITALKRSVTFDGRDTLHCEGCGKTEKVVMPVFPSMPVARLEWVVRFNDRITGFLGEHRGCK